MLFNRKKFITIDETGKPQKTIFGVIFAKQNIAIFVFAFVFIIVGFSALFYKNSTKPVTAVSQKLSMAISKSILDYFSANYKGDIRAEGHIILDTKTDQNVTSVYLMVGFRNYKITNSIVEEQSGDLCVPAVARFKLVNDHYENVDFVTPVFSDAYVKSIKAMFPEKLLPLVIDTYYKGFEQIYAQHKTQIQSYIDKNLKGQTPKWETVTKPLPFLNSALTKILVEQFAIYPPYLGSRTINNNGENIIYKTAYEKVEKSASSTLLNSPATGKYILTKTVNGMLVESNEIQFNKTEARLDVAVLYNSPQKGPVSDTILHLAKSKDQKLTASVVNEVDGTFSLYLEQDKKQTKIYSAPKDLQIVYPAFSSTGSYVAFLSASASKDKEKSYFGELLIYDIAKQAIIKPSISITTSMQLPFGYEWKHNSDHIIIKNGSVGNTASNSFIGFYDVKNNGIEKITANESYPTHASVSLDQNIIVYSDYDYKTKEILLKIYTVNSKNKQTIIAYHAPNEQTSFEFPVYHFIDNQNILATKSSENKDGTVRSDIYAFDVIKRTESLLIENACLPCVANDPNFIYYFKPSDFNTVYQFDRKTKESTPVESYSSPYDCMYDNALK